MAEKFPITHSFMDKMLKSPKIKCTQQISIFLIGLIIFVIIAYFGWHKLQYGFNFIDEGYHATESWRLTQGDRLLDNRVIGPLMPFTLINSVVYRINPEITLLGFRQLQFMLSIATLIVFGFSLFAFTRQYWHLPFVFSLFAFTGIDPTGMIPNLSYHTWPHLFLTLHVSFLLLGLAAKNQLMRRACLMFSGAFLFGIGFSLLYLNVVAISPVLIYVISRKNKWRFHSFDFYDLVSVLTPYGAGWLIFLGWNGITFFPALGDALNLILSTSSHNSGSLLSSLAGTGGYVIVALVLTAGFLFIRRLAPWPGIGFAAGLSILAYFIIETSFFGLIQPYYNGWFGRNMWLSALIMSFVLLFWLWTIVEYFMKKPLTETTALYLLVLMPITIQMVCTIIFSGLNALTVLHAAIPAMAALSYFLISRNGGNSKTVWHRFAILIFMIAPFYYTTAWSDWRFTYFDVVPEQMDTEITKGFGKGIKTNQLYARLNDWIMNAAEQYSKPDDYMLSYVTSSMTYMITRRRPALNDTFSDLSTRSPQWYESSIRIMKEQNREPTIAFIFERIPILFPISIEKGTFTFPGKQFDFMSANDPISHYVKMNMVSVGNFTISKKDNYMIRCYVDPEQTKERQR